MSSNGCSSCTSKALGLAPFAVTTLVYFYLGAYEEQHHGEAWSTVLKILPILSLVFFVYNQTPPKTKLNDQRNLIMGLSLSVLGDIFINLKSLKLGIPPFFIAHILYIKNFGWNPLKPKLGAVLFLFGFISIGVFYQNLEFDLKIGVPIYAAALTTTAWRAIARMSDNCSSKLAALGTLLFLASDSILSLHTFYMPIENAQLWILLTYYGAQLGIAMNVFDVNENKAKKVK